MPSEAAIGVGVAIGLAVIGGLLKLFYWKGTVDSDLSELKNALNEIKTDIRKIFERLPPPRSLTSGSPLKLTDLGKSISQDLNVRQWALVKADELTPELEGKPAYVIQKFCFNYVKLEGEILDSETPNEDVFSKDMLDSIASMADEHGIDEDQVTGDLPVRELPI